MLNFDPISTLVDILQYVSTSRTRILDIFGRVLLPAFSLVHGNPGLSNELWDVLKTIPYEERYAELRAVFRCASLT